MNNDIRKNKAIGVVTTPSGKLAILYESEKTKQWGKKLNR